MKSKMKLITRESREKEKNLFSINEKIQELKKDFRKKTYGHVGELYEILYKLVQLKKETNKRYTERSLEWEDGIDLKGSQIRYIFAYKYLCSYSKKKVEEGLIDDNTICHALAISSLLREPQWQKSYVDKIINKEITPSSISEINKEEIKNVLIGKNQITESDAYFLAASKALRNIKLRMEKREHLLNSSLHKQSFINSLNSLTKAVKIMLKEDKK